MLDISTDAASVGACLDDDTDEDAIHLLAEVATEWDSRPDAEREFLAHQRRRRPAHRPSIRRPCI